MRHSPAMHIQGACARPQVVASARTPRVPLHPPATIAPTLRSREWEGVQTAVAALLASACLAAAGPALAADSAAELFTATCAGCHAGGGNIVRRDATLLLADLQKNGLADEEAVYRTVYYGRNAMPGYGAACAPRSQCTFARRLSEEEIRSLAQYVLDQAAADWPQ